MKRFFIILTISLLLITACGIGVSKYEDAVLDGVSSLNTGKPERALKDFNRAIDIDPKRADGYLGRANTFNTMGHFEKALVDYNRVIEIEPTLANAYINRGIAHSQLGQYEKAIADYEKGLEMDPKIDNAPSFFQRLFDDKTPNEEKGIRKHLEYLKEQVQQSGRKS
jgi:tetratricopeptide (TPR) repeat protein